MPWHWRGITSFGIDATTPIPTGKTQVRTEFAYDGGGMGKGGTVTFYCDGTDVGTTSVSHLGADRRWRCVMVGRRRCAARWVGTGVRGGCTLGIRWRWAPAGSCKPRAGAPVRNGNRWQVFDVDTH